MKYGFVALLIAVASGAYAGAYDAGKLDLVLAQAATAETTPAASPVPATAQPAASDKPAASATPDAPASPVPVASETVPAPVATNAPAEPQPTSASPVVTTDASTPAAAESPVVDAAVVDAAVANAPVLPIEPLPAPRAPEEDYVLSADLMAHDGLKVGTATKLTIKLSFPNQRKVRARDLLMMHGRPVHVYAVDDALTDYQHLQPKAAKSGKWVVKFTPKKAAHYRLFVDVAPVKGKRQLLPLMLHYAAAEPASIDQSVTSKLEADGYTYTVNFDEPLKADNQTTGHINITDKYGRPITDLEPMMGSFAHVIGVSDDVETVTQTQPKGPAPKKRTERGGPDIDFTIEPKRIGHMKLFVHSRAGGKDRVVAMGVDVAQ